MHAKPFDPREQDVVLAPPPRDPYVDMPREEQLRRIEAIDTIGQFVQRYGFPQVERWAADRTGAMGELVDAFGTETVGRWCRYHQWRTGHGR